jgi:hypothetical protein
VNTTIPTFYTLPSLPLPVFMSDEMKIPTARTSRRGRSHHRSRALRRVAQPSLPTLARELERLATLPRPPRAGGSQDPFPPSEIKTLSYTEHVAMPTGAAWSDQTFAINSCFDPNYTGVGHQPRFYDQLCTAGGPYTNYRVLWCDVDVTVGMTAETLGTQVPIELALVPTISATALTAANWPMEIPGATAAVVTGGYQAPARIRKRFYPNEILGFPAHDYVADELCAANATNSPSNVCFVHAFAASLDGSTNVVAWARCQLNMRVQFFNRYNVGPS